MNEVTSRGAVTCTLKPVGNITPNITIDAVILPNYVHICLLLQSIIIIGRI